MNQQNNSLNSEQSSSHNCDQGQIKLHFRAQQKFSRGRTYHKKIYYCKICKFESQKKQNAIKHEKTKQHNLKFSQNASNNLIQSNNQGQENLQIQYNLWDPSKENIEQLVKCIIQPFLDKKIEIKDCQALSHEIIKPIENAIIQNIKINLAAALQTIMTENDKNLMHTNQLRLNVLQFVSSLDFNKLVVSFSSKLKEVHMKIQQLLNKNDRTYRNNQLCYQKFSNESQITFRNSLKFQQFSLSLSKFQRKDCKRYWNAIKKKDNYFSAFLDMKIFGDTKSKLARVIPKSLTQVKDKLQKILQQNPQLASDMWTIMSLALRSTDFQKIQLWDISGNPIKLIKLIQNKNNNLTQRYVPSSTIKLAKLAKVSFPMSKVRIKNAIKACLQSFHTCYGFRHRVISNVIGGLMKSASFLHFHRRQSTTINYYLQAQDEKILQSVLSNGINIQLSLQQQLKIQSRNLILDATTHPNYEFKLFKPNFQPITFENSNQIQQRSVSYIVDQNIKVQQSQFHQFTSHPGQVHYVANITQLNVNDEPEFNSIQQAIGSIVDLSLYNAIEDDVQDCIQQDHSQAQMYIKALAINSKTTVTYAQFQQQRFSPIFEKTITQDLKNDDKIVISCVQKQDEYDKKFHITNSTNSQKMNLRSNHKFKQLKQFFIIHKKQPTCKACQNLNQVSLLVAQDQLIKCTKCNYIYYYNLLPKNHNVYFITQGAIFQHQIHFLKSKTKNNLREYLNDKMSVQFKYSNTLPEKIYCNFFDFQLRKSQIHNFYKYIDYAPLKIDKSTIPGAGFGLFASQNLKSKTIVGAYIGFIGHSCQVDNQSDSIFQIGWYQQKGIHYLILCDGKQINQGSRYINTNKQSKCNCEVFLGVLQNNPINLIITNQQVKKGSELFFNYGPTYPLK